jgi:sporulation protein YlmC with PRC-barrel domain
MKHEYWQAMLAAALTLTCGIASAQSPARTDGPTPSAASAPNTATLKSANLMLDVFDYRASDLIGAAVLDERGERVAEVDDFVVSTEDDELHAVLAVGGFIGFGEKLITLPFDELQITTDGENPQVRIAMTGDRLQQLIESRPEFRYDRQEVQPTARAGGG